MRQADTVDFVNAAEDGTGYSLVMVEERLFDDSDEQLRQLMAKVNAYLDYIESGKFNLDYPDAEGKRLEIRALYRSEPYTERFVDMLRAAADLFARHGATFKVVVLPL